MFELSIGIVQSFPFPYTSIELRFPAIQITPGISSAQEI